MKHQSWWNKKHFMYVGRMAETKGINCALLAWLINYRKFRHECPEFWIVGGSPNDIQLMRSYFLNNSLFSLAEQESKIHWWGYLDQNSVSSMLLRTVALIFHSKYEPGGRIILEAMTEGVPVIATPNGFAWDLIQDWHNGFQVEYGKIQLLSQRMEHFIYQPLLRQNLGYYAKCTALNSLENWNFTEQHHRVYLSVINDSNMHQNQAEVKKITPKNKRILAPTYGISNVTPTETELRAFISSVTQESSPIVRTAQSCSSDVFEVNSNIDSYIIKSVQSRINYSSIWDPTRRNPTYRNQQDRFQAEQIFAQLNGTVKILKQNEQNFLLLFKKHSPISKKICELNQIYSHLQDFFKQNLPETFIEVQQEWLNQNDYGKVKALFFHKKLTCCFEAEKMPWASFEISILLNAWCQLVYQGAIENELFGHWVSNNFSFLTQLIELAEEENQFPLGWCHGSCEFEHIFRDIDKNIVLIDGDHIHIGSYGQDFSSVFISFLKLNSESSYTEVFFALAIQFLWSKAEQRLMLSWISFQLVRKICRSFVLYGKIRWHSGRFNELKEIFKLLKTNVELTSDH